MKQEIYLLLVYSICSYFVNYEFQMPVRNLSLLLNYFWLNIFENLSIVIEIILFYWSVKDVEYFDSFYFTWLYNFYDFLIRSFTMGFWVSIKLFRIKLMLKKQRELSKYMSQITLRDFKFNMFSFSMGRMIFLRISSVFKHYK